MKISRQKLYCFADESGQDTGGKIFLTAIVIKDDGGLSELRRSMEIIEQSSAKHQRKWTKTSDMTKQKYLKLLLENSHLRGSCFYSVYFNSKEYTSLLALTIARSVWVSAEANYAVSILIDGLQDTQSETVRYQLKNLKVRYTKIRGMKDEQDALLRLADSVAGFVRDYTEGQGYTQQVFAELIRKKIICEI